MNNLHREPAPISDAAWASIEEEARRTFEQNVAARRVVDLSGPEGQGLASAGTGHLSDIEAPADGVIARLRTAQPLVELRVPFTVSRQDVDDVERGAQDSDWQPVKDAAKQIGFAEDRAVFEGYPAAGIAGIRQSSSNPALTLPAEARETSDHGYPIREHLARVIDGEIVWAPAIDGAFLLSGRGGDFELRLGQDLSIGYLTHDADTVQLYFEESLTFLVYTTEASVAFGVGAE